MQKKFKHSKTVKKFKLKSKKITNIDQNRQKKIKRIQKSILKVQ